MRTATAVCALLAGMMASANAATPVGDVLPGKWLEIVNKTPWQIVAFALVEPRDSPDREIKTYDISGGLLPNNGALFDRGLDDTKGCEYYVMVLYSTGERTMGRIAADICTGSTLTLKQ